MSARSLSVSLLSTLAASAWLAASASADRLLVGGPLGSVFQTDTAVSQFEYFACQCGGPIQAMAADKQHLYTADAFGSILIYDVDDGVLEGGFGAPGGPATALAAANGALFAGDANGLVTRLDPASGNVVAARAIPSGVRALLSYRGFLFAAGNDGAIYRAPVESGDFTYFTCFCFFGIVDLQVAGDQLVVADQFGTIGLVSLTTGLIENAFWGGGQVNAMVVQDDSLLVHTTGAAIQRLSLVDGSPLPGGYSSPIEVSRMLVLRTAGDSRPFRARLESSK